MTRVCVYGAAGKNLAPEYFDAARELGAGIAGRGWGLVFGGGATGLMGAAAEGAALRRGEITGVAPEYFDRPGVLFQGCRELIFTRSIRERKQKMEDLSDAFCVLPGGVGTLEEFFEILTLRGLGRHDKPIALLNTRGYYDGVAALLQKGTAEGFIEPGTAGLCELFSTPGGLLDYLGRELRRRTATKL